MLNDSFSAHAEVIESDFPHANIFKSHTSIPRELVLNAHSLFSQYSPEADLAIDKLKLAICDLLKFYPERLLLRQLKGGFEILPGSEEQQVNVEDKRFFLSSEGEYQGYIFYVECHDMSLHPLDLTFLLDNWSFFNRCVHECALSDDDTRSVSSDGNGMLDF